MELHTFIDHCQTALRSTYDIFTSLGVRGIEPAQVNVFGDMALRGDVACEEAIIAYFEKHQVPVRITSEEHGITDIVENPMYLVTLDGIDGSMRYKTYFEGDADARFGTILAAFSSIDPNYNDYVCAGSLEHPHGLLYFCEKDKGVWQEDLSTGTRTHIHTSSQDSFTPSTRIYIDSNPHIAHYALLEELFITPLQAHTLICLLSSAAHYADLAAGRVDLVLECTRKGNLEIAYGYAMTREAGGVMLTLQGADMGPLSFLRYGQDASLPTIAASQYALAKECLNFLIEQSHYNQVQ